MITPEQRDAIEAAWLDRAKAQGLNPKTAKYARTEIEFFCGAMATLQALYPDTSGKDLLSTAVPPHWVMAPLTGRNIVDQPKA